MLLTTKSSYTLKLQNSHFTVYFFFFLLLHSIQESSRCAVTLETWLLTTSEAEVDRSRLNETVKLKKGRQLVGYASVTLKVSVDKLWSVGIVAVQLIYIQYTYNA